MGPGKKPTAREVRRFQNIAEVGCLACWLQVWRYVECEVHHILDGGRRIGHSHTIGLCPWHHRGVNLTSSPTTHVTARFGPSLAREKKRFVAHFGTEPKLLALQDSLLWAADLDEVRARCSEYRR